MNVLNPTISDLGDMDQAICRGAVWKRYRDEGAEGRKSTHHAIVPLTRRDVCKWLQVHRLSAAPQASVSSPLHSGQAKLPIISEPGDPNINLLALFQMVVDAVDTLFSNIRDVQEAVALRSNVHKGAEISHRLDQTRVLLTHLQLVKGDGRISHVLRAASRLLGASIRVVPLYIKGTVLIRLRHCSSVHVPIIRELRFDLIIHLVVLEDDDLPHVLRVDLVSLITSIRVVPLHRKGAVLVDLCHGAGVPHVIIWRHSAHIIANDVVSENDDLLQAGGRQVVGLRAAVGVVPLHSEGTIVVDCLNPARVPHLVIR
mmetsp:Transcript_38409/g.96395  ORF Transcript_38409/g.96395 Transcript_38409/m.96395 type:complete len:314 (-) Transcript_38409:316-1257(-)